MPFGPLASCGRSLFLPLGVAVPFNPHAAFLRLHRCPQGMGSSWCSSWSAASCQCPSRGIEPSWMPRLIRAAHAASRLRPLKVKACFRRRDRWTAHVYSTWRVQVDTTPTSGTSASAAAVDCRLSRSSAHRPTRCCRHPRSMQ